MTLKKDGKLNLNMIEFLIEKIGQDELTEENKQELEREQAVRQGLILLGHVPLKDWDPGTDSEEI